MAFYRRNLPHLQYNGGEYFVTFRLYGSLPAHVVQELKAFQKQFENELKQDSDGKLRTIIERQIFEKYESNLDQTSSGPHWLSKSDIAGLVKESIHFRDRKLFDLYAYCIMSNHVHMVFRNIDKNSEKRIDSMNQKSVEFPITDILGDFKKFTGRKCNRILNRSGSFWQAENFDRLIRNNSELENCILYTLNNPVKAKLIPHWQQWPHTYCKAEFLKSLG